MFILYFVLASVITTIATSRCFRIRIFSSQDAEQVLHRPRHVRSRFKYKHCKLIKTGGKPLALGFAAGSASLP